MSSQEEQLIELLLTLKKTTPDQARAILSSTPQIAYALISLMVKMNAIDVLVLQKTLTSYSTGVPPGPPATASSSTPSSTSQMPIQAPSIPTPLHSGAGIQPASALPPHLSQYRTPTPQTQVHTPPLPPPQSQLQPPSMYNGRGHTPQSITPAGTGGGYVAQSQPQTQNQSQSQSQSQYASPSMSGYGTPTGTMGAGTQSVGVGGGGGGGGGSMGLGMGMLPDALAAIPDEQKAMIMRVISMTPEQINMLPPTERASIIQLRTTLGLPS